MAELTTLQLALIDINLQLSDAVNKSTKSVYFLPNQIFRQINNLQLINNRFTTISGHFFLPSTRTSFTKLRFRRSF